MTLHIKNMVCNRCIKVVREELEKLGVGITSIELGEVETTNPLDNQQLVRIKSVLEENGFELIEDKRAKIIEKLKNYLITLIHHSDEDLELDANFSELISRELELDYAYLTSLFSSTEGITIEHYIISQKIERAKELLKYGELTLSEIAYKLGYSSVAHLSSQFKKVTGMTASQFKSLTVNKRKPLDGVK
jgi:AraC-like DNA-binding protein